MTDVERSRRSTRTRGRPEYFNQFHERVRDHPPEWVYEVVRVAMMLHLLINLQGAGF